MSEFTLLFTRRSISKQREDIARIYSETMEALMLALVDSSKKVSAVSNEQARNLESGHKYLVLGLFWTFLFVLSLIFAKILNAV